MAPSYHVYKSKFCIIRTLWSITLAYSELYRFQKSSKNCCEWLRAFFDISLVKETLMVAFKRGPNNRRLRVIMLVVVLCVVIGPIYGKKNIYKLHSYISFNFN